MKRIIKEIVAFICVVAIFVGGAKIWNYILIDDSKSYTRLMMHELYNSNHNIDILFVGSSHAYRSFNPVIMDEKFDAYTFVAGTSAQRMDGSLAIIKEAIAYNDIKKIYLEIYYGVIEDNQIADRSELTSTYIISDYMKLSIRKIDFLLRASSKDYYVNSFIPARRNWEKIFEPGYIKNIINTKQKSSYKNYQWERKENEIEYYVERGFVGCKLNVDEDKVWNSKAYGRITEYNILKNSEWNKSLIEIIELCKENNIELGLVMAPMPEQTIVGKGNYDEYSSYIRDIADLYQLKYYDFNLCKDDYFDINDDSLFMDEQHLSCKGAEEFSNLFAELCVGQILEKDIFFNSLEEKLLEKEPNVLGIAGPEENEENGLMYAELISNRKNEMEYEIIAIPDNGTERIIQYFNQNCKFEYPLGEHGTLIIKWRLLGDNNTNSIEVEY